MVSIRGGIIMRKVLTAIFALMILMCVLSAQAEGQVLTSGDFEYTILEDGTAEITRYNFDGKTLDIEIPSKIEEFPVTSIGAGAFAGNRAINTVVIPDSVTNIGSEAFASCWKMTSVTIPDSVTSIESFAFSSCWSLTTVTLPDSVTSIDGGAFEGCRSLIDINIPASITTIDGLFCSCTSLSSITIPDSVTTIGRSSFAHCTSLTSITIPDSVTSIGDSAFVCCTDLIEITIPDSVTSIGFMAFEQCFDLKSVVISNPDTSIGDRAFYGCTSLTDVTLPNSMNLISMFDRVFKGCSALIDNSQANWNNPYTTIYSAGRSNPDYGTTLDTNLLGRVLYVQDEVGGWFRMIAPEDGDYVFSVLAPYLERSTFSIVVSLDGQRYDSLRYERSNTVQSKTIKGVKKGQVITWWDNDDSGRGWTLLDPFYLMIDIEQPASGCTHNQGKEYSVHPHKHVYCKECDFEFEELYSEDGAGREISTCNECFSLDTYYKERALAMAQKAKSVYGITNMEGENVVAFSDNYKSRFDNDAHKTESRIEVSSTTDGELVVTVSFEGSTKDSLGDFWDDWISKDFYTQTNAQGIRIGFAEGIDRFVSNYIVKDLYIDCNVEGWVGKKTFSELLFHIKKDSNNARLRITGHSLGASYAQCFAYYMISKFGIPSEKIETYTFASLIPFTNEFVEKHTELQDANIYNFIHVQDLAPDIGPTDDLIDGGLLELPEFLVKVAITQATEFGGESLDGSNIGKNIYLNSDLEDGLKNMGETHAMDTYLDLIANFEDKNHDGFDQIDVLDVIANRKHAKREFDRLTTDLYRTHHVVYKINGVWYKANTEALGYDMLDAYMNWGNIVKRYGADEIALCPIEATLISVRPESIELPAGDTFTSNWIMAGAEVLPNKAFMSKEKVYKTIVDIVNEYHKYDYLWHVSYLD